MAVGRAVAPPCQLELPELWEMGLLVQLLVQCHGRQWCTKHHAETYGGRIEVNAQGGAQVLDDGKWGVDQIAAFGVQQVKVTDGSTYEKDKGVRCSAGGRQETMKSG